MVFIIGKIFQSAVVHSSQMYTMLDLGQSLHHFCKMFDLFLGSTRDLVDVQMISTSSTGTLDLQHFRYCTYIFNFAVRFLTGMGLNLNPPININIVWFKYITIHYTCGFYTKSNCNISENPF